MADKTRWEHQKVIAAELVNLREEAKNNISDEQAHPETHYYKEPAAKLGKRAPETQHLAEGRAKFAVEFESPQAHDRVIRERSRSATNDPYPA
jgi:hypothetical protein